VVQLAFRRAPLARRFVRHLVLLLQLRLILLGPLGRRPLWVSMVLHLHGRSLMAHNRLDLRTLLASCCSERLSLEAAAALYCFWYYITLASWQAAGVPPWRSPRKGLAATVALEW
jgi:hypothetical protein